MPLKPGAIDPKDMDTREFARWCREQAITADDGSVNNASFASRSAFSVIGRAGSTAGIPGDIAAASNDQFLVRRSNVLVFAALLDADIPAAISRDSELTAAMAAHEAAANPHPDYTTSAELAGALESGTYTPSLVNVANAGSLTAFLCQYLRVGIVVSVSGRLTLTATVGATPTQVGIPLSIASNIANSQNVAGVGSSIEGFVASIYGDATNNRATFEWLSADTNSHDFFWTFQYLIL